MIRRAVRGDESRVVACVHAAFAPFTKIIGRAPAPMGADYAGLIAADRVHVMVDADDLVCGVLVVTQTGPCLEVDVVAVWPELSGRGIGKALLAHAEAIARQVGAAAVVLCTNAAMTSNIGMYQKLGYQITGRGRQDGFDRVFFRKELKVAD